MNSHRIFDGPIGELDVVAEVPQVIDVNEDLLLELRERDDRNGAVLVERACVGEQSRREVAQVRGDLLDHVAPSGREEVTAGALERVYEGVPVEGSAPHLGVPDHLRVLELAKEHLRELLRRVVLQIAKHRLRQHVRQDTAHTHVGRRVLQRNRVTVTVHDTFENQDYNAMIGWMNMNLCLCSYKLISSYLSLNSYTRVLVQLALVSAMVSDS